MSTNPYNDDRRLLELLERWQSGDFSRADERELLSLTESDAFRRETVEGFWALPETDHAMHLAILRTRFRNRIGAAKRVVFPQILAAIAAVSLLVLAVIWLLPNAEKTAQIAQQEAPKPIENQPIASTFPDISTNSEESGNQEWAKLDRISKTGQGKAAAPNLDNGPAASTAAPEVASSPPELRNDELAADKMVREKPSDPEPEYKIAADEQDDVDLKPGNAARSEAKKETLPPAPTKDAKKMKAASSTDNSQPLGGWSNFQDYLRRNARLPEAARQNNVSGSVRLKFRLDDNNQPMDFQILKALGYGCEEEAIRLVKAYSWQLGKSPEVTLDVPFIR